MKHRMFPTPLLPGQLTFFLFPNATFWESQSTFASTTPLATSSQDINPWNHGGGDGLLGDVMYNELRYKDGRWRQEFCREWQGLWYLCILSTHRLQTWWQMLESIWYCRASMRWKSLGCGAELGEPTSRSATEYLAMTPVTGNRLNETCLFISTQSV